MIRAHEVLSRRQRCFVFLCRRTNSGAYHAGTPHFFACLHWDSALKVDFYWTCSVCFYPPVLPQGVSFQPTADLQRPAFFACFGCMDSGDLKFWGFWRLPFDRSCITTFPRRVRVAGVKNCSPWLDEQVIFTFFRWTMFCLELVGHLLPLCIYVSKRERVSRVNQKPFCGRDVTNVGEPATLAATPPRTRLCGGGFFYPPRLVGCFGTVRQIMHRDNPNRRGRVFFWFLLTPTTPPLPFAPAEATNPPLGRLSAM